MSAIAPPCDWAPSGLGTFATGRAIRCSAFGSVFGNRVVAGVHYPHVGSIEGRTLGKFSRCESSDQSAVAGSQLRNGVAAEVCHPDVDAIEDHTLRQASDGERAY